MRVLLILLGVWFPFIANAKAKETKVACVDMGHVLESVPDTQKIRSDLEIFGKQLQNELTKKMEQFQIEVESFKKGYNTMTENARKQKEIELQVAQESIEQLRSKSEDSLAEKRGKLLDPLLNRIIGVVSRIAKERGYTLVLNREGGMVNNILYIEEELDITDDIIKELNEVGKLANKK
jgi:outer membrane protein